MHLPRLRRRADQFAELVDHAAQEPSRPGTTDEDQHLHRLVDLAHHLTTIDDDEATPRPQFVADLRARLIATGRRNGIGHDTQQPPAGRRLTPAIRRALAAAGITITAAATVTGTVVAANGAVPGDTLYSIKRSAEQTELALANSNFDKGMLDLSFARIRLNEADAIVGDDPDMLDVLDDMDTETRQGVRLITTSAVKHRDPGRLAAIDRFVADQRALMPEVISDITGTARTRAETSRQLLDTISARTAALRAGINCTTPTTTVDDLGPKAATCTTANAGAPATAPPAATPTGKPSAQPHPTLTPRAAAGQPQPAPTAHAPPAAAGTAAPASPTPTGSSIPDAVSSIVKEHPAAAVTDQLLPTGSATSS